MQAIHHWQCWFCCEWILNYKSLVLKCNAISVPGESEWGKLGFLVCTILFGVGKMLSEFVSQFTKFCFGKRKALSEKWWSIRCPCIAYCNVWWIKFCAIWKYKSALPKRYGPLPVTPTKYKAPRSPTTLSLCKFANFIPALQVKKLRWKWRNKKHMKY